MEEAVQEDVVVVVVVEEEVEVGVLQEEDGKNRGNIIVCMIVSKRWCPFTHTSSQSYNKRQIWRTWRWWTRRKRRTVCFYVL